MQVHYGYAIFRPEAPVISFDEGRPSSLEKALWATRSVVEILGVAGIAALGLWADPVTFISTAVVSFIIVTIAIR